MIRLQFSNPTPASRIRHQGARHWHDEPYASWLTYARLMAAREAPPEPLQGPICLAVVVIGSRMATPRKAAPGGIFDPRKERSRPDWAAPAAWKDGCRLWRPVRPDDDNYGKAIRDAMNGRIFADDGQIVSSLAYKVLAMRGEEAKILVWVGKIEEQAEIFGWCAAGLGRVL